MDGDAPAVQGGTLAAATAGAPEPDGDVLARPGRRSSRAARSYALRGNLAPDGAVVKLAGTERRRHRGPARVFDGEEACVTAVREGHVEPGDVLVVRYEGPAGGPGMREMLSVTSSVVGAGLGETRRPGHRRALLRRHARVHGGARVARGRPRRAARGRARRRARSPIDIDARSLSVDVPDAELARRLAAWVGAGGGPTAGIFARYRAAVASASRGRGPARARRLTRSHRFHSCGRYIRKTPRRIGAIGALASRPAPGRARGACRGVDDAVVPQARAGVVGVALLLVLRADRRSRPVSGLAPTASSSRCAACSPPITRDARVRPHPQEARASRRGRTCRSCRRRTSRR